MAEDNSGGDVYFARGGPQYPHCSIAQKAWRPQNEWHGMVRTLGVMHVAAPPIKWQREESVCGSCLVLDGGEACQVALPQCSWRPRRLALLPREAVQTQ